jgi:hypothetical protein
VQRFPIIATVLGGALGGTLTMDQLSRLIEGLRENEQVVRTVPWRGMGMDRPDGSVSLSKMRNGPRARSRGPSRVRQDWLPEKSSNAEASKSSYTGRLAGRLAEIVVVLPA